MMGERDLNVLLRQMNAELDETVYVFVRLRAEDTYPAGLRPRMVFEEEEGTTLILPLDEATQAGLETTYPCKRIVLKIHSALEAVGFLARITKELAGHGISANAVSAYFHDHVFVPEHKAKTALDVLRTLSLNA